MHSCYDAGMDRNFRCFTEIYTVPTLKECFDKLKLGTEDLIITTTFMISKIQALKEYRNIEILNVDMYGSGEPNEDWINKILVKTNASSCQRVIAIGGGATIDLAKLCIFADGRNVKSLFEEKELLQKRRGLVVLPTTCGTGSEVTSISVVEFHDIHSKLGLQIDSLFPDKAILVDELLMTLPYRTFVLTSIDALSHAIESLLSPKANPYTTIFAKEAIEGIVENLKEVSESKSLPKDMKKSLICANMAGIAFSIAGCGTMHALSFPLGANYHLAHGEAIYAVFDEVLNYYLQLGIDLNLLQSILKNVLTDTMNPIKELLQMLSSLYERPNLRKMGITITECQRMAISVFVNQQRLLVNAPKVLNAEDITNIYKKCIREDVYV